MAFMLGSFAGGLWQGASSAMSLAREYQAFQTTQAQFDAADELKKAQDEQNAQQAQNTAAQMLPGPGTFTTTSQPASTGGGTTDSGPIKGTGTGDTVTSSALPSSKKAQWPPKVDAGKGVPEPPEPPKPANQGLPGSSQAPGASTAGVKGAPGGPSGDPVYGPAGPPTSTGANAPPSPTTGTPSEQKPDEDKSGVITTPGKAPGVIERLGQTLGPLGRMLPGQNATPAPGGPYGSQNYQPPGPTSAYPPQTTALPDQSSAYPPQNTTPGGAWQQGRPSGAIMPAQSGQTAGVQGKPGSPSGPAVAPNSQRPAQYDPVTLQPINTATPGTPPAQPPTTQPTGGYFGSGAVGRAMSPVSPQQQPPAQQQPDQLSGPNAVNWATEQARKSGQEVPVPNGDGLVARPNGSVYTPGGGFRRQQGALPASNQYAGPGAQAGPAQPPSDAVQGDVAAIQQGIQNAQNARAQGQPPGTVAAAGPAAGQTQPAPQAPPGTYDTGKPSAAALKPQTGQQTPGPVTVPATPGKGSTKEGGVTTENAPGAVAPDQKGPSTQSEKTPPILAPHVNPAFWQQLQRQDPEYAAIVKQVVDKVGGGHVSYETVAATLYRESKFNRNPALGSYGEHGVMQVMPDTQRAMMRYLGQSVNPDTVEGSLTLGVAYLRYLAVDQGLGDNSVQTNFAYMRGPGAVNAVARDGVARSRQGPLGNALGWLDNMYGDHLQINDSMFTGGHNGPQGTHYSPDQLIRAGNGPGGPDALLNVVATTGPAGLGMSGRWASAQAAVERAAIMKGDWNALPHISEWFAQQSHQGAIASLAAAHSALLSGDTTGAVNALARAHAFFPDGVMGRFGIDKDGQLWGERFDEGSGQRIGQPFKIGAEDIARQAIMLKNPGNYIEALDAHRKVGAQIALDASHSQYYATADEREAHKQEMIGARESALETQRQGGRQDLETQRQEGADRRAAAKGGDKDYSSQDTVAANKTTDRAYSEDNRQSSDDGSGKPIDPGTWSNMAALHSSLVKQSRSGGGGATSASAQHIVNGVRDGSVRPVSGKDANGNAMWGFYDSSDVNSDGSLKEGAHAHAYLPKAEGDQVLRPFARAPKAGGGGQQRAAIGSGLGTQMAAQGGYGSNLANQPTSQASAIPMRQTAPESMAA